jgi:hypothetical protein
MYLLASSDNNGPLVLAIDLLPFAAAQQPLRAVVSTAS